MAKRNDIMDGIPLEIGQLWECVTYQRRGEIIGFDGNLIIFRWIEEGDNKFNKKYFMDDILSWKFVRNKISCYLCQNSLNDIDYICKKCLIELG